MPITTDVAALLASLGCGTHTPGAAGGDIFVSAYPDTPDVAMAVVLREARDVDAFTLVVDRVQRDYAQPGRVWVADAQP
jgi:hypothetical protein